MNIILASANRGNIEIDNAREIDSCKDLAHDKATKDLVLIQRYKLGGIETKINW